MKPTLFIACLLLTCACGSSHKIEAFNPEESIPSVAFRPIKTIEIESRNYVSNAQKSDSIIYVNIVQPRKK